MGFNLITTDQGGLPDFLRELGGYQDEGLGAGIQPRAPKLGITQDKRFTLTKDGVTIQLQDVLRDAQGKEVAVPAGVVRIIVVAASGNLTKAWYETGYEAGKNDAPDCFSNDGKVPAPGVAKPQCSNCAQCPKNAFGSNPVTGRGKACSDRKMIVCVWEGAPDELMTFNVPTMSLQSLQKLDAELRNANIPMQSVLIGLSFDPGVAYPVVKMNPLGFVDKETTVKWREAAQSAEVAALLREQDYSAAVPAEPPVPNNQIAFGQSTGQAAEQTQAQPETQVTPPAATEAPKRTRRTKAEMEAARAAAAAAGTSTSEPVDTALQAAIDAAKSNGTATPVDEEDEEDEEEAELLRQLEAKRAAKAAAKAASATASTQLNDPAKVVAEQPAGESKPVTESVTTTASGANVLDLLSRWKT